MEKNEAVLSKSILEGHTDQEKTAYLCAIAAMATADRQASPQEVEYISQLCEAADLPEDQVNAVIRAANEVSGESLKKSLDVLKNSELRFSVLTDLMAFAKSDSNYSEEESQYLQKVAQYLGVDQKQFALLNQFADDVKAADVPEQGVAEPGFLSTIKEKLAGAGINTGSLMKGLVAIGGPLILAKVLSGRRGGSPGGGGMFSGLGGVLAGAGLAGGIGSLIGMFNGGNSANQGMGTGMGTGMGNLGGLLGRVFGGKF